MNEKRQKQRGLKQGFELIYEYRFVLSFLLLIMLVSFKISGSSMEIGRASCRERV